MTKAAGAFAVLEKEISEKNQKTSVFDRLVLVSVRMLAQRGETVCVSVSSRVCEQCVHQSVY